MLHMKIVDITQQMLNSQDSKTQSQNSEMRRMAQEMSDYSNAQILKLAEERQRLLFPALQNRGRN